MFINILDAILDLDEISFQKTTELRKLQDEEYKKMIFFQNLKKGMNK